MTNLFLNKEELRALSIRQDWQSGIRFVVHFSLLLINIVLLIMVKFPIFVALLVFSGAFLWCTFYAPLHESTHKTAFKSKKLNILASWISSFFFGCSPGVHREQHFTHHRFTNIKKKDPEILIDLKETRFKWVYQLIVTTIVLNIIPLYSLCLTLTPTKYWNALAPFIASKKRKVIQIESLLVTVFWLILLFFCFKFLDQAYPVLLMIFLAKTAHSFWTYVDHEGLGDQGSMLDRTRSFKTNRFLTWFMWNMNYHAEHHLYPYVPWNQLPQLSSKINSEHSYIHYGYLSFYFNKITTSIKRLGLP